MQKKFERQAQRLRAAVEDSSLAKAASRTRTSASRKRPSVSRNLAFGLLGAGLAAAAIVRARRRAGVFKGKVVLITGGSRGLGLEIARQFGLAGAHLSLAARRHDELQAALSYLHAEGAIHNGGTALTVVGDVSRPEDAESIVRQTIERYGRIDVLVNNAGVISVAPFVDQTLEAFHEAMNINFYGAVHMVQATLPYLQRQGSGHIVNIASIGGKVAVPHMLPYVASKFALVGFSEGLHSELRSSGIRVTTVNPGLVRSGSHVQAKFAGDAEAEFRWFFSGMVPGVSKSARGVARDVFNAAADGRAEITITPQAWLAARVAGIAPGFTSFAASLANDYLMPAPTGNRTACAGSDLPAPKLSIAKAWSQRLQSEHNQNIA